jgi:hypothetical protein
MQFLLEKAKPQLYDLEGRRYSDKQLRPINEPEPTTVDVCSLQGLVSYFKNGLDSELGSCLAKDIGHAPSLFFHVEDYRTVSLCTPLHGPFLQRSVLLRATTLKNNFQFGQFQDSEKFAINVQSEFCPSENRSKLLQIAGNVEVNASVGIADDGVSQRTTAKTGIARREEVVLPNPVTLQPYRTFPEIKQPECQFVFRMRQDQDSRNPVSFALFEADGNRWQIAASRSIAEYLTDHIETVPVLL